MNSKKETRKTLIMGVIAFVLIAMCFLFATTVKAQSKDSIKLSRQELTTLQRNALIIQQQIHSMHLDALLRDKLDSVYSQSAVLFDERLKVKEVVKPTVKKP